MPNFSRTVTVKQDINTVYDFMSDFRNLSKWAEGDEGELITKEPLRLGSNSKSSILSILVAISSLSALGTNNLYVTEDCFTKLSSL